MRSPVLRLFLFLLLLIPATTYGQRRGTSPPRVTSPRQAFGHDIGDDYFLVNYTQMIDYWRRLDRE